MLGLWKFKVNFFPSFSTKILIKMQSARTIIITQSTFKQWRGFTRCAALCQNVNIGVGAATTTNPSIANLTIPPPSNIDEKPVSIKIEKLVTEISQLNLIEVCELSGLLKKRLNLPDAPAFTAVAPAAAQGDMEDEIPKSVKSIFNVKLMKFDEKQKVPLIKEIKSLLEGMNLVQAKKFVESAPAVVKTDVSKEEADKLKEAIEKVGGVVEID